LVIEALAEHFYRMSPSEAMRVVMEILVIAASLATVAVEILSKPPISFCSMQAWRADSLVTTVAGHWRGRTLMRLGAVRTKSLIVLGQERL
jgi:hypothetical protein